MGVVSVLGCLVANRTGEEHAPAVHQLSLRSVEDWIRDDRFGAPWLEPTGPYDTALIADRFDSWAYAKMDARSKRLGSVRQGRVLWGKPESSRRGCAAGWYALAQGGYACAGGSFRLIVPGEGERLGLDPALDSALPYHYVRVTRASAPRYDRVPTREEELLVSASGGLISPALDVLMEGDYFLAVIAEAYDGERRFYRTLRQKFVRAEDAEAPAPSAMHGKRNPTLPLAFVVEDGAAIFRLEDDRLDKLGIAPRYGSLVIDRIVTRDGAHYVTDGGGLAIRASAVRLAMPTTRPADVDSREKWIHVDLSEQVLVAYVGDTPVFATLVSSGKPGHETPTGAYRIQHKHISTTMTGEDPVDGRYEVEEVPWTMYYDRGYALHGAYWHDEFGQVRSHGCTNLAPADARWLLRWTEPPLPAGWHSIRARTRESGTRVYITQ
jgi:hypothetical protein